MADLALQKLALNAILSLPTPILRMLSGGGVVHKGGRTLDPHFQLMAAQAKGQPPMSSVTAVEARMAAKAGFALASARPEPGVRWEARVLDGPDGPVPTRVYRPDNQDPDMPALTWLHMGGGVIGDLETCHAFCTVLARTIRCAVISVDYRLAPEHRYPAGLDDSMFAYRFVRDHAADFGAPAGQAASGGTPSQIAIGIEMIPAMTTVAVIAEPGSGRPRAAAFHPAWAMALISAARKGIRSKAIRSLEWLSSFARIWRIFFGFATVNSLS